MDREPQRTQDDAAVGYEFQRPPDPEFPAFGQKQARWALGDDSIIDNHDKWKYSVNNKMTTPPNIPYLGPNPTMPGLYDLSQNKNLAHEQVMYLSGHLSGQMQGGLPLHPSYVTPGVQQQIPLRQGPQAQVG
ncbi:hypothetical protein QE152_g37887 [Popillia japonica]|uniref:Uncharacterized protein n=1 Tax=Popillia japonica TaxID=7064 RepID=A0AAW1I8Q6_POPJA